MLPSVVADRLGIFIVQVDSVHQLAVDVELKLLMSGVADAHRPRAAVAFEVVQDRLREIGSAVNAIHHLQWRGFIAGSFLPAVFEPIFKPRRLFSDADAEQSIQSESGIANPSIAIIPIADAADAFGQAARRGSDKGPRGLKG